MLTLGPNCVRSIAAERVLQGIAGLRDDCAPGEDEFLRDEEFGIMKVWAWMEASHHCYPSVFVGVPLDSDTPPEFITSPAFRHSQSINVKEFRTSGRGRVAALTRGPFLTQRGPFLVADGRSICFCEFGMVKRKGGKAHREAATQRATDWKRLLIGPPMEVGIAVEVIVCRDVDFRLPRRRRAD